MKQILSRGLCLALLIAMSCAGKAQDFDFYFNDATLRLDYAFAGDANHQNFFLDEIVGTPGWYGRRVNLDGAPVRGNGQIEVRDEKTNRVIYRTFFSSLFQEWVTTDEAAVVRKSFENCFQIPEPKQPALVTVTLWDKYNHETGRLTHRVDPKDILIRRPNVGETLPCRMIHEGGSPKECIDVAILAEGYTEAEMELFYEDARKATEALFHHEPFRTMQQRFNVVAVASPSKDSGVSIPGQNLWLNTAVGSHFDTFYSDRYLTTLHLKQVHNLLLGIPYEHIVILANTDNYGGGGILNSYTLSMTHNAQFLPVVVHEFGHSFAGLADEYTYGDDKNPLYVDGVEPWEENITTLVDFESKWKDMLAGGVEIPTRPDGVASHLTTKVGVYEGAGYREKGVYRPTQECRMKVNTVPEFCPVCQRALQRMIDFYTQPAH